LAIVRGWCAGGRVVFLCHSEDCRRLLACVGGEGLQRSGPSMRFFGDQSRNARGVCRFVLG
jgi:hypothetical protein